MAHVLLPISLACLFIFGWTCRAENAAPSVHLSVDFQSNDAALKMQDIKVIQTAPASYFEVNWFNGGYAGLQHTPASTYGTPNILLSSLWDPNTAAGQLAAVDYRAPATFSSRFGGEGDGWKTVYPLQWQLGVWYRIVHKAWREGGRYVVATFVRDGSTGAWLHTATLSCPSANASLLYSHNDAFLENWDGSNPAWDGRFVRKAALREAWIQTAEGVWQAPRSAYFSANDSAADALRNGIYHNSFNCYVDAIDEAYVFQHGGSSAPSSEFVGTRKLQLPLLRTTAAPALELPVLRSLRSEAVGSSGLRLSWDFETTSSPLWKTEITVTDLAGVSRATASIIDPELHSWSSPSLSVGAYQVRVRFTDIFGQIKSPDELTQLVGNGSGAPTVELQPVDQTVAAGAPASFSIIASGTQPIGYQWLKNGNSISGATAATLALTSVSAADAGEYSVRVTNAAGSAVSVPARLIVTPSQALSNLSVRTTLASGQTLIVGAVVVGGAKSMLARAGGPALNQFGLLGMADPRLELYTTGTSPAASNDDWSGALASTFGSVGAFAYPNGSKDAALTQTIGGSFTLQAKGTSAGTVLVELYDLAGASAARLANLSARNQVRTGADVLIAGFTLGGTGTGKLLIRGVGPGLSQFGLSGVLADPKIQVFDGNNSLIATNDNWDGALAATFAAVGAFGLPVSSKDAALLVSLKAGSSYTVIVSGADGGVGEALVEIYELQ